LPLIALVIALLPPAASGNHSPYLGIQASWDSEFAVRPPHALATGLDGSVYAVEGGGVVTRFDRDGRFLSQWGGRPDDPDTFLSQDIAVGASGAVYVTVNDYDTHKVVKFSPTGELLATWDGTNGTHTFYNPAGITTDLAGNVYVSDGPSFGGPENFGTFQFTEEGEEIRKVGEVMFFYLARDSAGYFFGSMSGLIQRATPAGEHDGFIGSRQFGFPPRTAGVAVAADGTVWGADPGHYRVLRFTRDGNLLDACGGPNGPGALDYPEDVAPSGDSIVVADAGHIRRIGMVTHPAPACDGLRPRLDDVELHRGGRPRTWIEKSSLELFSSEPTHASVTLGKRIRRHWRHVASGRADLVAGAQSIELAHLFESAQSRTGRYRIKVRLSDEAENRSRRQTVPVRVAR
jgi:hypothetical protein